MSGIYGRSSTIHLRNRKKEASWRSILMATLLFFPLGFLLFYYKMVRETNKRKQNGRALMIAGGFGLLCVLAYVILALYGGAWNTRVPVLRRLIVSQGFLGLFLVIFLLGLCWFYIGTADQKIIDLAVDKRITDVEQLSVLLGRSVPRTCDVLEKRIEEDLIPGAAIDYVRGRVDMSLYGMPQLRPEENVPKRLRPGKWMKITGLVILWLYGFVLFLVWLTEAFENPLDSNHSLVSAQLFMVLLGALLYLFYRIRSFWCRRNLRCLRILTADPNADLEIVEHLCGFSARRAARTAKRLKRKGLLERGGAQNPQE